LANGEAEREFGLELGEVLRSKEIVGKRLEAEIQDELAVGRIARAAAEGWVSRRHGEIGLLNVWTDWLSWPRVAYCVLRVSAVALVKNGQKFYRFFTVKRAHRKIIVS